MSAEPKDLASYWRDCTEVVGTVVPYYWTPCWFTLDPASLLITSHFHEGLTEFPAEWLANEYYGDDLNNLADIARSHSGISTLHEAAGGDPSNTPRWRFNQTMGGDQEMIARLRAPSGEVWGMLGLYRATGRAGGRCSTNRKAVHPIDCSPCRGGRQARLVDRRSGRPGRT
ncbi:MAG TPA: hypothetical protein VIJ23_10515 [Mycobacterium sp.]